MGSINRRIYQWLLAAVFVSLASSANALWFGGGDEDGAYTFPELIDYDKHHDHDNGDEVEVPEPGTIALLGLGLLGIGIARSRRKR
ncbi:PEP-CTERM sorting domain-containing protein [Marinobacter sp. SS21]|nr:PEP-CTERM sorting domain-containing protein [Marinobacter sp. SS21]MDC0663369.1 PEP-CTERM sorting domain-containing protein [Marinobacter sp. SS21]